MHDVFVSYSHSDKDWVRTYLVPLLHSWGLSVAVDHMEFIPGQRLSRKITDYINDSKHLLFVCTPAFLRSQWCKEELEIAHSNDPSLLKAIPLVL
ncbi:MAG TPA: toll/interleukin-1 receptor domain-containing protein, partial [Candidatus Binatia bacterium]|nr:toll/interleukin-1 receptor domain-containing protein [Candidatus Binatia bacterium]